MLLLLLALLQAEPLCANSGNITIPEDEDARELAERYANGDGVAQDFAAAIRIICADQSLAEAEREGMLEHVVQMQRGETDAPLDFCEHATSRGGMILCAARRDEEETPALRARYDALRTKHGPPLDRLRARADAFIDADTSWEVELHRGGTMYAYAEIDARLERETKFIELLERYSQQRAPAASQADFKRADAALNAAYRERMASIEPCTEDCDPNIPAETDNLRAAQRAWIAYRDAWIAWYQQRWRGAAAPEALRREIATVLSRERSEELGRI